MVADDDSDIPQNLHNIVVSIHAIATFQALHEYLRPRVAGLLSGGYKLSGMFAALTASGLGPGSTSRTTAEGLRQSASAKGAAVPGAEITSTVTSSTVTRRRSQRLSAKRGLPGNENHTALAVTSQTRLSRAVSDVILPESPIHYPSALATSVIEAAPEDLVHDSGFTAEFTDDDEIDAEARFYCFGSPVH